MTILERKLRREVPEALAQGRPIIIELQPGGVIGLRQKGRRTVYYCTVSQVYSMAAKIYASQIRAEKAAKRAARRASK